MSKYRISIATSGYYYVQRLGDFGWYKVGPFFRTRAGARAYAQDLKYVQSFVGRGAVVEYV